MASGGDKGFTLLELLVALVLLGLLAVIGFGGLRFGLRAWEAGGAAGQAMAELSTVQGFLRRQIAQAYPLFLPQDQSAAVRIDFEGAPDFLSFVAPLPADRVFGGLHRLTLRVAEDAGGHRRLVLDQRAIRPDDTPAPAPAEAEETILADGIEAIELSYFGPAGPDQTPAWRDSWRDMPILPRLIRLRVRFDPATGRAWPELTAAPVVDLDRVCQFDPIAWRCQGR